TSGSVSSALFDQLHDAIEHDVGRRPEISRVNINSLDDVQICHVVCGIDDVARVSEASGRGCDRIAEAERVLDRLWNGDRRRYYIAAVRDGVDRVSARIPVARLEAADEMSDLRCEIASKDHNRHSAERSTNEAAKPAIAVKKIIGRLAVVVLHEDRF